MKHLFYTSILSVSLCLWICTFSATAQVEVEWDKTLEDTKITSALAIEDEGYLLAGVVKKENSSYEYWVGKLDENGNKLWDKTYGVSNEEGKLKVVPSADEGYLLATTNLSPLQWIAKIDKHGNKLWEKTFGNQVRDRLRDVIATPDGGYLLGYYSYKGEESGTIWIIKIDANGDTQWDRSFYGFGIYDGDYLSSMIATPDGGYLLGGANSEVERSFWIIKIDEEGNQQWRRSYRAEFYIDLHKIINTPDGGYLLATWSNADAFGDKSEDNKGITDDTGDYWIIKIDGEGNKIWDRTLGGNYDDRPSSVMLTPDGGYLIAGSSRSDASGDKTEHSKGGDDYWVVKIDDEGNKVWDKTLGGANHDYLTTAIPTLDGGYLLAGLSSLTGFPYSGKSSFVYKIKTSDFYISGFTLINAENDEDVRVLREVDFINLALINNVPVNIRANVSSAEVDYIEFTLSGPTNYSSQDKHPPFTLFGDDKQGDYDGQQLSTGNYTLTATPFAEDTQGVSLTVTFELINDPNIWDKTLGGIDNDYLTSAIPTSDGGYLLAGWSPSSDSLDKSEDSRGSSDYWIVKTDSQGNKLWDKTFGGSSLEWHPIVSTTADGGYLLAGSSSSNASGDKTEDSKGRFDYWIVKIDEEGNKLWDKTLGGNESDELRDAIPTADGGFLLAGRSYSNASGNKTDDSKGRFDYWVVKTDSKGNKLWDKTFGGSDQDDLHSVTIPPDGGYLLVGSSYSNASGDKSEVSKGSYDYWLVKIDEEGNQLWDRTLGGNGIDDLKDAKPTADGGYLLAGSSSSNASGDKSENNKGFLDYWLVKIDGEGNKIWDMTLGGNSDDQLSSITSTTEGYLLAGSSRSNALGDKIENSKGWDYWVVKVDQEGNKLWDETIGGDGTDELSSIITTTDGYYLLAGYSDSRASIDKSEDRKTDCNEDGECFMDYWIVQRKDSTGGEGSELAIQGLVLVNAQTGEDIQELREDEVINLDEVDCHLLSIRANTTPSEVDSVHFNLEGPLSYQRMERKAPYALFGDHQGDYKGKKMLPGEYTLTVTPYGGEGAQGVVGNPLTLHFEVVLRNTIADILKRTTDFSQLASGLKQVGSLSTLSGKGPYTVFAPTDAAFTQLLHELGVKDIRRVSLDVLKRVLRYHVVAGQALTAADLRDGQQLMTLCKEEVSISLSGNSMLVNGVSITETDIMASNGVIHVIDEVLMPAQQIVEVASLLNESDSSRLDLEIPVAALDIMLSPNPGADEMVITTSGMRGKKLSVTIATYQGLGSKTFKFEISHEQEEIRINTRAYKQGIYLIHAQVDQLEKHAKLLR